MNNSHEWFEVLKLKDHLHVIRERLDEIEPRFHTKFVNLYLIKAKNVALLIDTGCGLYPLKPLVNELIEDRKLIVINTHSHFDHRGSNHEFDKVFIHEVEANALKKPLDISFLKDSPKVIIQKYGSLDFKLPAAQKVEILKEGDEFDLGGIKVQVFHTPGHSGGSISLITNKGELFTGDTAHYGTMFLPRRRKLYILANSLKKLKEIYNENNIKLIYPSHEEFGVGIELIERLIDGISKIESMWNKKVKDPFLQSWILEDDYFKYSI